MTFIEGPRRPRFSTSVAASTPVRASSWAIASSYCILVAGAVLARKRERPPGLSASQLRQHWLDGVDRPHARRSACASSSVIRISCTFSPGRMPVTTFISMSRSPISAARDVDHPR